MLYEEWIDFVIYPLDSNRVLTREQRLDTSNAVRVSDKDYTPTIGTEKGTIYPKESVFFDFNNDKFEAMAIDNYGGVVIWTTKKVWFLLNDRGLEKLKYVPRHPDSEKYS